MPVVSEKQRRAMEAAAHGRSTLGIPRRVAEEFLAHDDSLPQAAGVLFVSPEGRVLLMHRSPDEKNYGGHWGLPGGGGEAGETPIQTALREAKEETGYAHDGSHRVLSRVKTPNGMMFTTFAAPVDKKFVPQMADGEHTGFTWADPAHLPAPLHPQVAKLLGPSINVAEDMTPEDWAELRDNLSKWTLEEEFAEDAATLSGNAALPAGARDLVGDSAVIIAMDRDSVRETTRDGRLKIKLANISKANVSPYRGKEIPGWKELGLDPDRVYNLLRDPDELRKAAGSLNGVQLLRKHVPVNADDHQPHETVGSLGTDAEFDGTYLKNSLFVNARDAIDGIESGKKRELSAGYHYKPDMTPGNFNGNAYDGVMRDIEFNHVALVEDGRAGPDVVVGDSKENVMKPTRFAVLTLHTTAATLAPMLAMDSKITLPKEAFLKLTQKNFKDQKGATLAAVRSAIDGKLRAGLALDASMDQLAKALDTFGELDDEAADDESKLDEIAAIAPQSEPDPKTTTDAEPLRDFLRAKGMAEDDIAKACEMADGHKSPDATDEDKGDDDKDKKKDEDKKDKDTKQAMDEAIQTAVKGVRDAERGIRVALAEVKPWVGDLPATMAFDGATDVYRHTAGLLKIDGHKTMHADALLPVIKAQPRPGTKAPAKVDREMAMDSSVIGKATKLAPGLAHITIAR